MEAHCVSAEASGTEPHRNNEDDAFSSGSASSRVLLFDGGSRLALGYANTMWHQQASTLFEEQHRQPRVRPRAINNNELEH